MFSLWMIQSLVSLVMGIIEGLLTIRVLLRLLGAGEASFVTWVYETTAPLVAPFEGMFPQPTLSGGFVIEFSTLFALMVYSIAGYLLLEVFGFIDISLRQYRRKYDKDA
ncbi:MAG: YggT family protein [Candidatus Roizmanbacteria bacterium]|nr:YggT family protein [Candidatus Roizmanbacteria bacterium]